MRGNSDYFAIKQLDYGRLLVISLGTGTHKEEEKYDANGAAKWGLLGWLTNAGSTPLVDVFTQASADMVDYHLSVIFQALHTEKNYLRIQVIRYLGTREWCCAGDAQHGSVIQRLILTSIYQGSKA